LRQPQIAVCKKASGCGVYARIGCGHFFGAKDFLGFLLFSVLALIDKIFGPF